MQSFRTQSQCQVVLLLKANSQPQPQFAVQSKVARSADCPTACQQVTYSTYTEADYDAIWDRYAYQSNLQEWFYKVRGYSPEGATNVV